MRFFLCMLGISGLLFSAFILLAFRKHAFGFFHVLAVLFLLASVDVFAPAVLWSISERPPAPEWQTPASMESVVEGLVVYIVFYLFLLPPFVLCHKRSSEPISYPLQYGW